MVVVRDALADVLILNGPDTTGKGTARFRAIGQPD